MADNKKMVEAITSMEEDFGKWYTDVVKKAEEPVEKAPEADTASSVDESLMDIFNIFKNKD